MSIENSQKDTNKITNGVISRLHVAWGVQEEWGSLVVLAKKLGIKNPNTISNWRNRGVPHEKLTETALNTGFSLSWLETGEGPMRRVVAELPTVTATASTPAPSHTAQTVQEALADFISKSESFSPRKTAAILKTIQMMTDMDDDPCSSVCLSAQDKKLLQELLRQRDSNEKAG